MTLIPLWAALLADPAAAAARILVVADAPVTVSVNRHVYNPKDATYLILCDPGRNRVQVGNAVQIIDVPDGHEARLFYTAGSLELRQTLHVPGLKDVDYVDFYYDPTEDPASQTQLPVKEVPVGSGDPAATGPGTVSLRSQDGGFYNVKLGDVTLAELRSFQDARKDLQLKPGRHLIEVWDGSNTILSARGYLEVPSGGTVVVWVSASGLTVDGDPKAWTPSQ